MTEQEACVHLFHCAVCRAMWNDAAAATQCARCGRRADEHACGLPHRLVVNEFEAPGILCEGFQGPAAWDQLRELLAERDQLRAKLDEVTRERERWHKQTLLCADKALNLGDPMKKKIVLETGAGKRLDAAAKALARAAYERGRQDMLAELWAMTQPARK